VVVDVMDVMLMLFHFFFYEQFLDQFFVRKLYSAAIEEGKGVRIFKSREVVDVYFPRV
jgi:hypothetical protein